MTEIDFRLYCITDRHLCAPVDLLEVVKNLAAYGVKAVQLREKDLPAKTIWQLAKDLVVVCAAAGTKVFINDRVDIARAVQADGVQLTSRSLPVRVVREKLLNKGLIGVSTHALDEALAAQRAGADFVLFGPVFETPSKRSYGAAQGVETLRHVARALDIPVFAVGGINPDRAAICRQVGAHGVAVISALMQSQNIAQTVSEFKKALD